MDLEDDKYMQSVAMAALDAVVDLTEGVVEPIGAIDGLCLAIAMLAGNTSGADTPKARRELADRCRKQVLIGLANYQSVEAAGWNRADRVKPSDVN